MLDRSRRRRRRGERARARRSGRRRPGDGIGGLRRGRSGGGAAPHSLASGVTEDEIVAAHRGATRQRGRRDEAQSRVLLGIGDDAAVWQPSARTAASSRPTCSSKAYTSRATRCRSKMPAGARWSPTSAISPRWVRGRCSRRSRSAFRKDAADDALELYRGIAAAARRVTTSRSPAATCRARGVLTIAIAVIGEVRAVARQDALRRPRRRRARRYRRARRRARGLGLADTGSDRRADARSSAAAFAARSRG